MKDEILERSDILNFSCDIFTISQGWGRKTEMWISNTCYCNQPPGFIKGVTQLMFICVIENIFGHGAIFKSFIIFVPENNLEQVKVMINIFFGCPIKK